MRKVARKDSNHNAICDALRQCGATVQTLHNVGDGCPDIIAGFRGQNYLFEIKDGEKYQSQQQLTWSEQLWHRQWRGHVAVVGCIEDALREMGAI